MLKCNFIKKSKANNKNNAFYPSFTIKLAYAREYIRKKNRQPGVFLRLVGRNVRRQGGVVIADQFMRIK